MTVTVDASVWVAAHDVQDPHHRPCRRFLLHVMMRGTMLRQPLLSAVEVSAAVARKTRDTGLGWRAGRTMLAAPGIVLHPLDRAMALEAARFATRLFLRGADAIYVATAAHSRSALVTTDAEVRRRAAGVLAVHSPDEWLALNIPTTPD